MKKLAYGKSFILTLCHWTILGAVCRIARAPNKPESLSFGALIR